jgi:hypothetical protein
VRFLHSSATANLAPRRTVAAAAFGLALVLSAGAGTRAWAQDSSQGASQAPAQAPSSDPAQDLDNSQVAIAYLPPTNPAFQPLYERLKARAPLEELREFLAPLKLPHRLTVQTGECGATYVPYAYGPVTICYEYLDQIERLAPADVSADGVTRANAIAGAFVQVALHQVADAVFNNLQVPIWGREEDAADKLAGFIMMQFGTDVALRTLTGTDYFFEASDHTWTGVDFSDERSTEDQRFYNYLCIAYGGDPATFGYVVQKNILPSSRASDCAHEYAELTYAFNATVMPYVDPGLLAKVRATPWLRPDDGQYPPPPPAPAMSSAPPAPTSAQSASSAPPQESADDAQH